jgi:hypothetical protein
VSFNNPIVGSQGALIRDAIRSRNYVAGVSGWSINKDGFAEFNNVAINGGELLINDPVTGDTVASIDNAGTASFQDLNVVNSPSIGGLDFQTEIIDPLPRGLKAYGSFNVLTFTGLTGEFGLIEIAHPSLPARTYNLYAQWNANLQGGAGNNLGINIRYEYSAGGTPAKPTLSSTLLYQNARELTVVGVGQTITINIDFELPQGPGAYRFLCSAIRLNGTGATNSGTSAVAPVFMSLKDIGPTGLNTGVLNTGAGGATAPVQTYTKNYFPLWSRSYNGNGTPGSFTAGSSVYQGYNQSDGNGIRHSMIGYDWATIQADLASASIQAVKWTAYFAHWYNNSGGIANIGYHNYAGGSAPGAYQTVGFIYASTGWPKPGLRTVDLTATGIGTQLKNGAAKGITLGDGASSSAAYYGYANGATMGNPPYLTITYTK